MGTLNIEFEAKLPASDVGVSRLIYVGGMVGG